MIIPNKLKILGFDWSVEINKDVAYQGNVFGSTHHSSQKIFLEPEDRSTKQKQEQVFLHEVMHAVWWSLGLVEIHKDNPIKISKKKS